MSDGLLSSFKIALLVVIYLFFFRVLRTVWAQLKEPRVIVHETPIATQPPARPPIAPPAATNLRQNTSSHTVAARLPVSELSLTQILPEDPSDEIPKSIAINANPFIVGRSRQANLPIDDSFASQRHAQLTIVAGVWHVEDLGSTNGTSLNGVKISDSTAVAHGDRLTIGNHHFEVQ